MVLLQLLQEIYTQLYPACLEINKVEPTTAARLAYLGRKVDELRQGSANLHSHISIHCHDSVSESRTDSHRRPHG